MESTLFLRSSPLASLPIRISSPLSATRLTNPNFSSNHSSLSLPNSSYQRPLRHAFSPIVCAVNRFPTPSTNDESDSKIVRGTVGASLVLACVVGIISCGCMMSPKANAISPSKPQALSTPTLMLKPADTVVESKKKPPNVESFKRQAKMLAKCGRDEEVLKPLRKALKDIETRDSEYGEPNYQVEMALVEVLIYLGRYEEAIKCKCLNLSKSSSIKSDARVPLYKGIIYTMLDEKENAMTWWKKFARIVKVESELPLFPPN
nr:hypothetical protein CFP56_17091 [Quercus suber]